jgi:uncharacterized delta-60 repeat protein
MKSLFLALILVISPLFSRSQLIDHSFHSPRPLKGANINALKVLADQKIMLAGNIQFYENTKVNNLVRLNSDGTLDKTFSSSLPEDFLVYYMDVQSTNDVVVAFVSSVVATRSEIILLSNTGATKKRIALHGYFIDAIKVQTDNKILVVGGFNGKGFVKRYNADLTEDATFNTTTKFDSYVEALAMQNDKIVVTGLFSKVNDITVYHIARLNADGSFDNSFTIDDNTSADTRTITIQSDNKILLRNGYAYTGSTGKAYSILRLHEYGTLDETFTPPVLNGVDSEIVLKGDKILIVGKYGEFPNASTSVFMQLSADGTLDASFTSSPLQSFVSSEAVIFDVNKENDIILANYYLHPTNEYGIVKIDNTGTVIPNFKPQVSAYGDIEVLDTLNDQLIVGGDFVKMNDVKTFNIARINANGSVDPTMTVTSSHKPVQDLKVLDEQGIYVSAGYELFKIDGKGTMQNSFNVEFSKPYYSVGAIRIQKDGKVIGAGSNVLVRVNTDGTSDPSFSVGSIPSSSFYGVDLQSSGQIIFGSNFKTFNGYTTSNLVRLNADGSADKNFKIGTGPDGTVANVQVMSNDEILVNGYFKNFNSVSTPAHIVKLSSDGSLDMTFNQNIGVPYYYPLLVKLFEDKIYLPMVGYDTTGSYYELQRINTDGTSDPEFYTPDEIFAIRDMNSLGFKHNSIFVLGKTFIKGNDTPFSILKVTTDPLYSGVSEDIAFSDIHAYPNPVTNKVYIDFNNEAFLNQHATLNIVDGSGRSVLKRNTVIQTTMCIDLEDIKPGFYIISLESSEFKSKPIKIIKR